MLSLFQTVQMTADRAREHLKTISPDADTGLIDEVSLLVERLFAGKHPDYKEADLKYHNLEHTLLATQCFIDLARGRVQHDVQPGFSPREFVLGYVAIILHDVGYLKMRGDASGTGAKYTTTHVDRSCAMARTFLSVLGCSSHEIEGVMSAIRCTGLTSKIEQIAFHGDVERVTGCMVATADYLGQMADPNYVGKLPALFAEFEESNDFNQVPVNKRVFSSVKDLMSKTGGFWSNFVLPKLEREYEGVYRCLAMPDGRNPYIQAVEANLLDIAARAIA